MKTRHASATRFRFAVRKAALTLTAAVLVAATQMSFGATGPGPGEPLHTAVFQLGNSLKFKAVAACPVNDKMSITLRDAKKQVVYSDTRRSTGTYVRTFDLSALSDGEYTFEITNGGHSHFKTISIETMQARVVNMP